MHLSDAHGDTVRRGACQRPADLRRAFPSTWPTRTGASMALAIADVPARPDARCWHANGPTPLLVLGDRGEMLAGAIAALHVGVPGVHVHGGERSGTVDEPVRHAISKLASYHFVATDAGARAPAADGRDGDRIFVTGAPGLDGLAELGAAGRARRCRQPGPAGGRASCWCCSIRSCSRPGEPRADARLAAGAGRRGLAGAVAGAERRCRFAGDPRRPLDGARLPAGSRRVRPPAARRCSSPRCGIARRWWAIPRPASSRRRSFGTPVVNIGTRQRLREHGANVVDVPAGRRGDRRRPARAAAPRPMAV